MTEYVVRFLVGGVVVSAFGSQTSCGPRALPACSEPRPQLRSPRSGSPSRNTKSGASRKRVSPASDGSWQSDRSARPPNGLGQRPGVSLIPPASHFFGASSRATIRPSCQSSTSYSPTNCLAASTAASSSRQSRSTPDLIRPSGPI